MLMLLNIIVQLTNWAYLLSMQTQANIPFILIFSLTPLCFMSKNTTASSQQLDMALIVLPHLTILSGTPQV
jgi:hypothetical protein